MLNHLRTLLLNQPYSTRYSADYPGEEVVAAEFIPVVLSPALNSVHRILFGADPDRAYRNWRLREYLGLLRAGELASFETRYDSRLTYQHGFNDVNLRNAPWVRFHNWSGSAELIVLGTPQADDGYGRIWSQYRLEVASETLTVTNLVRVGVWSEQVPLVFSDGVSQAIDLDDTGMQVRIPLAASLQETAWELTALARPQRSLVEIRNDLDNLLGNDGSNLFDSRMVAAGLPWKQIWQKRDETVYRLVTVVLALGEQIEQERIKT